MKNTRFEIVKASKFDKLSNEELQAVKGGFCISCMKRDRKIIIDFFPKGSATISTGKEH